MVESGNVLFRWRSYLLFAFVPFIVLTIRDGGDLGVAFGETIADVTAAIAIIFLATGQLVRILTVGFVPRGTSGRNTAQGQVADVLNMTGAYSLCRNPIYLGNCLMYSGIVLYAQNLWLLGVLVPILGLYYERIIAAEEDFLQRKFGSTYGEWVARVPPFWPRLSGWRRPGMPFSLRTVIRREHASIFGAFLAVYLIELGLHTLPAGAPPLDPLWHQAMAALAVVEVALLVVLKSTKWLVIDGR